MMTVAIKVLRTYSGGSVITGSPFSLSILMFLGGKYQLPDPFPLPHQRFPMESLTCIKFVHFLIILQFFHLRSLLNVTRYSFSHFFFMKKVKTDSETLTSTSREPP